MKLSVKGFAFAGSMLFGASIFLVGLTELFVPGYGQIYLDMLDSLYPGFPNRSTLLSVLIGTIFGLVDGAIGGGLFAWLNNKALEWF